MHRFRICVLGWLPLVLTSHLAAGQQEEPPRASEGRRAVLEKEFAEKLLEVELVGQYSITTGAKEETSKPDRYQIDKVTKVKNDYWVFYYRRSPKLVLPIPLKVVWADDTPMISMTNETIPAMGTFSVRLLFHGDRYAGTWQHGEVGGHMWGMIEKRKPAKDSKKSDTEK